MFNIINVEYLKKITFNLMCIRIVALYVRKLYSIEKYTFKLNQYYIFEY